MSDNAVRRITLLSFRTFGDYVLKAPFLFELRRRYPDAVVTMITNHKGGQVYPLMDSQLQMVVVDHGDAKGEMFTRLLRTPRAELLIAMDDSRTTLLLSLLMRARRKTGWVQGISLLYAEGGFFEWKSVRPWVSALARSIFRPGKIRRPEDKHDGYVELELLDLPSHGGPIAQYQGTFALPRGVASTPPYIYCAAEAGWLARQLTDEQWTGILAGLLEAFPQHSLVVHGARAAVEAFAHEPRVIAYGQKTVEALFRKIAAAALVIAPDSFALHLASFYDVPAIGYFGPAHPHRFRPTGPRSTTLFHQPGCSPCLQRRGTAPCRKGLIQCASLAAMQPMEFITAARTALG